jgi:hypothetical protein
MLSTPAFGEPANFEAFDFKNCLHWTITNEMHGDDLRNEPKQYIAALELANRQPYSRHKTMSAVEFDRMYKDHFYEVVIVYSALAHGIRSKKVIEKYGVCRFTNPPGIACLPNQDFPLAGAQYTKTRSKGDLPTLRCVAGCEGSPAVIHDMGYENMGNEKNIEQEAALRRFTKVCGRAP